MATELGTRRSFTILFLRRFLLPPPDRSHQQLVDKMLKAFHHESGDFVAMLVKEHLALPSSGRRFSRLVTLREPFVSTAYASLRHVAA